MSNFPKNKLKNVGGLIKTDRKEIDEIDYIHKLSDEEKAWLQNFVDQEIDGNFRNDKNKIYSAEKRREIWRKKEARKRDIYNRSENVGSKQIDSDSSQISKQIENQNQILSTLNKRKSKKNK